MFSKDKSNDKQQYSFLLLGIKIICQKLHKNGFFTNFLYIFIIGRYIKMLTKHAEIVLNLPNSKKYKGVKSFKLKSAKNTLNVKL